MMLSLNAGDTFLTASKGIRDHLWFIISDPALDELNVLFVNLTTWKTEKDESCILDRGDHPFITHKSIINYADARVTSIANLAKLHELNQIYRKEPLSPAILARIRQGLRISPHSIHRHKKLMEDQSL